MTCANSLDAILTHKVWGYLILIGLLVSFFGMVYGVGMLLERPSPGSV